MAAPYRRQKGQKAERLLADWLEKVTGVKHRRVPMSGALHVDFPFDVMKMEQSPTVFDGVGNESKWHKRLKIGDWISQIEVATEDAGYGHDRWFVWFMYKSDNHDKAKPYFLVSKELMEHLLRQIPKNDD